MTTIVDVKVINLTNVRIVNNMLALHYNNDYGSKSVLRVEKYISLERNGSWYFFFTLDDSNSVIFLNIPVGIEVTTGRIFDSEIQARKTPFNNKQIFLLSANRALTYYFK